MEWAGVPVQTIFETRVGRFEFKSQVELGGDFADRTMRRRSASTQLSRRHLEPPLLENKSDIKRNEIKLI